jgi:hypothetical protein
VLAKLSAVALHLVAAERNGWVEGVDAVDPDGGRMLVVHGPGSLKQEKLEFLSGTIYNTANVLLS